MRRVFTHLLPGMLALLAALELTLQALPVSDATMKDTTWTR